MGGYIDSEVKAEIEKHKSAAKENQDFTSLTAKDMLKMHKMKAMLEQNKPKISKCVIVLNLPDIKWHYYFRGAFAARL